jgi:hypothetical protein
MTGPAMTPGTPGGTNAKPAKETPATGKHHPAAGTSMTQPRTHLDVSHQRAVPCALSRRC